MLLTRIRNLVWTANQSDTSAAYSVANSSAVAENHYRQTVSDRRSEASTPTQQANVVCCTMNDNADQRWFCDQIESDQISWYFTYRKPLGLLGKLIKRPNLQKIYSSFWAVKMAKAKNADLLISHEAELTFWCAFFSRVLRVKVEHIAFAFNYPFQPSRLRRFLMTQVLDSVNRFVVSSSIEKQLYQQYFKLPADRIEVQLWKMGHIDYAPEQPIELGDYICAVGQYGRDYPTLISAMEQLPDIKLILINRSHNSAELPVPPNVKVLTDVEGDQAMNMLNFSRFMVLPLMNSQMPTGHITLVAAMKLSKAIIITRSRGILDYVEDGHTALTYQPADVDALARLIRDLWTDPAKSQLIGENAKAFAEQNCSEVSAINHLKNMLVERGLLAPS